MEKQPRKVRQDLTPEERERLERHGGIDFRSIRAPDRRVQPFISSRTQH
jgi:hypothetical protein